MHRNSYCLLGAALLVMILAPRPAAAEKKGEVVAALGLNIADIQETNVLTGATTNSGTEIGFSGEAGYNYSFAPNWSVEAGLMYWTIGDVNSIGPTLSGFYEFSGTKIGLGYIPEGIRFLARQPFSKKRDGKGVEVFGQLSLAGSWADSNQYDSILFGGFAVGVAY